MEKCGRVSFVILFIDMEFEIMVFRVFKIKKKICFISLDMYLDI